MFCALSILIACGEEEEKKKPVAEPAKKEVLTETKNGTFTQYYPGKKKVKFQGPQDAEGRRHGICYFFRFVVYSTNPINAVLESDSGISVSKSKAVCLNSSIFLWA